MRKAEFLEQFAACAPIHVLPDELIVGSQMFNSFRGQIGLDAREGTHAFSGNMGHVIVDYGRVLQVGLCGLRDSVDTMPIDSDEQRRNQHAFQRALSAFQLYIGRHAQGATHAAAGEGGVTREGELLAVSENCSHLAEHPPQTFWQALQLTWFVQVFLHAESSAVAFSFGRFDQFLWPFLERDLADGLLTMDGAAELLSCFWLKCCEGDESQNLTVGGTDSAGRNAENPLSHLCLQVARELAVWQPSVSVRVTSDMSEGLWDAAVALCAAGFGMPAFFNDAVVTRALEAVDIPRERARDWGIVGCYEASPQGDCCSRTTAGQWVLPNGLLGYLRNGDSPATFDAFKVELKARLQADYEACRERFQERWDWMRDEQASPFESLCLTGCTESGLSAEAGGSRFDLFGVNVLGLGTLADSVYAIKKLVYETGVLSLDAMRSQLERNFADEPILARCRGLPGKYGTDNLESRELAAEFAHHVADTVLSSRLEHGVRPYPGLFVFTGWAHAQLPATPDGRRDGEPVSYGVGPSVHATGKTPTSCLAAAAAAANDRCGCGNPMMLSFSPRDLAGAGGHRRLRELVETYFGLGGFHLQFNVVDAQQLREAKDYPEQHTGLLVRISGFSAQFVTLDERLQDALIDRIEQGV